MATRGNIGLRGNIFCGGKGGKGGMTLVNLNRIEGGLS